MSASKFIIRYKSGAEVAVTADSLSVKWDTRIGEVIEMRWENMRPRPMSIGLPNIESVWEVVK